MAVIDTIRAAEWCYLVMNMKCLKWLNLLPFIMFFIVDKLRRERKWQKKERRYL